MSALGIREASVCLLTVGLAAAFWIIARGGKGRSKSRLAVIRSLRKFRLEEVLKDEVGAKTKNCASFLVFKFLRSPYLPPWHTTNVCCSNIMYNREVRPGDIYAPGGFVAHLCAETLSLCIDSDSMHERLLKLGNERSCSTVVRKESVRSQPPCLLWSIPRRVPSSAPCRKKGFLVVACAQRTSILLGCEHVSVGSMYDSN